MQALANAAGGGGRAGDAPAAAPSGRASGRCRESRHARGVLEQRLCAYTSGDWSAQYGQRSRPLLWRFSTSINGSRVELIQGEVGRGPDSKEGACQPDRRALHRRGQIESRRHKRWPRRAGALARVNDLPIEHRRQPDGVAVAGDRRMSFDNTTGRPACPPRSFLLIPRIRPTPRFRISVDGCGHRQPLIRARGARISAQSAGWDSRTRRASHTEDDRPRAAMSFRATRTRRGPILVIRRRSGSC